MQVGYLNPIDHTGCQLCHQSLYRDREIRCVGRDQHFLIAFTQMAKPGSSMHQRHRFTRTGGPENFHGPLCIPLHQLPLVRVQEYAPLFDILAEDFLQVFLALH